MPLFLPPLARGQLRRAPLDLAGQRERRAAHLVERPAPLDAHVDVHAARARRLRPADQPEVVQRRAHHAARPRGSGPSHARHGIEIDAQLVGMVEIVRAHRVWVQLEAGEIGHPHQRGCIARHHFLGGPARRKAQRRRPRSSRAATRGARF